MLGKYSATKHIPSLLFFFTFYLFTYMFGGGQRVPLTWHRTHTEVRVELLGIISLSTVWILRIHCRLSGLATVYPLSQAWQKVFVSHWPHLKVLLWGFFLYAVNMCCYHWLINKAAFAYGKGRTEPGKKSKQRYIRMAVWKMPDSCWWSKTCNKLR